MATLMSVGAVVGNGSLNFFLQFLLFSISSVTVTVITSLSQRVPQHS